jgi:hypothetical protein
MMTGCRFCGVGPEDECRMDCQSRAADRHEQTRRPLTPAQEALADEQAARARAVPVGAPGACTVHRPPCPEGACWGDERVIATYGRRHPSAQAVRYVEPAQHGDIVHWLVDLIERREVNLRGAGGDVGELFVTRYGGGRCDIPLDHWIVVDAGQFAILTDAGFRDRYQPQGGP